MSQIVLSGDVAGLGSAGELVDVRPGRARNHLVPWHLGTPPPPQSLSDLLEEREKARKEKEAKLLSARGRARALAALGTLRVVLAEGDAAEAADEDQGKDGITSEDGLHSRVVAALVEATGWDDVTADNVHVPAHVEAWAQAWAAERREETTGEEGTATTAEDGETPVEEASVSASSPSRPLRNFEASVRLFGGVTGAFRVSLFAAEPPAPPSLQGADRWPWRHAGWKERAETRGKADNASDQLAEMERTLWKAARGEKRHGKGAR